MPRSAILLAALCGALVLPSSAPAATVKAQSDHCPVVAACVAALELSAAPGERNDLTFTVDGIAVVVRDDGAPLVADRNCAQQPDGSVRCQLARAVEQVEIDTGDGDDVVRTPSWTATTYARTGDGHDRFSGGGSLVDVYGGAGDDEIVALGDTPARLRGAQGDDFLASGGAADELIGAEGSDRMAAGGGDDVLSGREVDELALGDETPRGDVIDGGAGTDRLSYRMRRVPVVVDLADPGPDGAAGEGDVLFGIEDVQGGDAGDRLSGDGGPNVLSGEGGADRLAGRGGDDELRTGTNLSFGGQRPATHDVANGGSGDDVVRANGRGAVLLGGVGDDVISPGRVQDDPASAACGPGRDVVRVSRRTTPALARSCERWDIKLQYVRGQAKTSRLPLPVLRRGAVAVNLPCARGELAPCALSLRVTTAAGRLLGRDAATARAGQRRTLVARLRGAAPSRIRVVVEVRRPARRVWGGVVVPAR